MPCRTVCQEESSIDGLPTLRSDPHPTPDSSLIEQQPTLYVDAMSLRKQTRGLVTVAVTKASTPTTAIPLPNAHASTTSIDVAASVLTNPSLLSTIGSLQEDPVTFVATYKWKLLRPVYGADGYLVSVAIRRGDLLALRMMFMARLISRVAAKKRDLSFGTAFDVAVSEGQVEIIQWLHARSQQYPAQIPSYPDTDMLLKILRDSRMDIVRCLFDLHDDEIDEHFMRLMPKALCQSLPVARFEQRSLWACGPTDTCSSWALSLLQLFVQQRPALHDTLLELAAGAGSISGVSYMLSAQSGADRTAMVMLPAMIAAARGGNRDLVEMLFAAKRADEVIDRAVLRRWLYSVGDASALRLLRSVVAGRDPVVQKQLNAERKQTESAFVNVKSADDQANDSGTIESGAQ